MHGLMQHWPLTVDRILDHARTWHGSVEVVSRSVEGPVLRTTYGELHTRAKRVSSLLRSWGVKGGERIATLAWNTHRHMEVWYGVMGIGAVCHTLNLRLSPDQLAWIVNHAGDEALFADISCAPMVQALAPLCPRLKHIVFLTDEAHMPALEGVDAGCYESLIAEQPADCAWGGFDEQTACGLCYTSGTVGEPKGVLYSHRSNFLHTMMTMQPDVFGCSARDAILMVVPMFHANSWGLAFTAPAVGAKLVLPGPKLDGASIHGLLEQEAVTLSAAVPTVCHTLLQHLRAERAKLSSLRRMVIGGAACPGSLIAAYREEQDVEVLHAWGMTEMSPLGTVCTPTRETQALPAEAQARLEVKQGRPPLGVELKIVDEQGARLPHDGASAGRLMARGAAVAGAYFNDALEVLDEEGFFDTGDIATIDAQGYAQIVDRAKDVIKSGGEWISSIELENAAMGHEKVLIAAAIGVPDERWGERPLLLVRPKPGEALAADELLGWLAGRIPKWWMPDRMELVEEMPLGPTGKIDKKRLRAAFTAGG